MAGLAASYAVLVAMAAARARAYQALAAMVGAYAILTAGAQGTVEAFQRLASWNDFRVFIFIAFSLFLAGLLRELGVLKVLVDSSGCRLAMVGVPAVIGLMPMPGGALVSAMALREKYLAEARVSREWATYMNYWFRHVWVPSWPLFQSIVITAAVLGVDPVDVIRYSWPGTPSAILAGLAVSAPVLSRVACPNSRGDPGRFLAALAPLASVAILILAGVPLLAALAIVVLVVTAVWRPDKGQLLGAARLALSPKIHLVLFESLLFKNLILATSAGEAIVAWAEGVGVPPLALAFMLPFTLGLAAGGENFFAATAIPALLPLLLGPQGVKPLPLAVAYTGGFLGVMASPVHLCLALTVEYYEASLAGVMARVAASILLASTTALLIAWHLF